MSYYLFFSQHDTITVQVRYRYLNILLISFEYILKITLLALVFKAILTNKSESG